ncbi:MAG: hypothetical protein KDA89_25350 [Planctomycetaceae bacterium]|nr:hypothetical protein [Planctomycetaceae bacterium]
MIRDAMPAEANFVGPMFEDECGCTECVIHELLEDGLDAEFQLGYGIIVRCDTHPGDTKCPTWCTTRSRADAIIVSRWRP